MSEHARPDTLPTNGNDLPRLTADRSARVFFAIWLAIGLGLIALRVEKPTAAIGATWNDMHVLLSSWWFEHHGFAPTLGLPINEGTDLPDGAPPKYYGTFPPGVFWSHELLRRLGLSELWHFRIAMIIWAQGAVWMLYLLVRRLTHGSGVIALIAATLYMLSAPYTTYAGGFWEHKPLLTLFLTLWAWVRSEQSASDRERRRWWIVCAGFCALDSMFTLQHATGIAVFVAVRALWGAVRARGQPLRVRARPLIACAIIAAVPALVFVARIGQLTAAVGWSKASLYLQQKSITRLGIGDQRFDLFPTLSRILRDSSGLGTNWGGKNMSEGGYPLLAAATLALALPLLALALLWNRRWKLATRPPAQSSCYLEPDSPMQRVLLGFGSGMLLLLGGYSWAVLVRNHASIHAFVGLNYLPGAAVTLASLIAAPLALLSRDPSSKAKRMATVFIPLSAALLVLLVWDGRRSELLNAFTRLSPPVQARIEGRIQREQIIHTTTHVLLESKHVERVWLYSHGCITGQTLNFPFGFVNAANYPPKGPRRPEEYTLVDIVDGPTRTWVVPFLSTLPAFAAYPACLLVMPEPPNRLRASDLVMLSDPANAAALSTRVVNARFSPTIDGSAFALVALFDASHWVPPPPVPLSPGASPTPPNPAGRSAFFLAHRLEFTLLDERGEAIEKRSAPLRDLGVERATRAVAWMQFSSEVGRRARSARLVLSEEVSPTSGQPPEEVILLPRGGRASSQNPTAPSASDSSDRGAP